MSTPINPDIYDKVEKILGIPLNSREYWDIYNNIEGTPIYLAHYNTEKISEIIESGKFDYEDINILLSLRGTIVDVDENWICCKSFPFTAKAQIDKIENTNGKFVVKDEFNRVKDLSLTNCEITPYYTGPIVRVWKYNDKTYLSSHKRINAKSKWGTEHTFDELFISYFSRKYPNISNFSDNDQKIQEIGKILFNPLKKSCNLCHAFMLCSPQVLSSGSRLDIGNGFLIYLKSFKLNNFFNREAFIHYEKNTEIEYDEDNKWVLKEDFATMKHVGNIPYPKINQNKIIKPEIVTYEVGNELLSSGYSGLKDYELEQMDPRIRPGESLVLNTKDGLYSVILASTASEWRNEVLDNSYNLFKQYCKILNYSFPKSKFEEFYEDLFPELGYPSAGELIEIGKKLLSSEIIIPPLYKKSEITKNTEQGILEHNKMLKKLNISYCFLYAVPTSQIIEASGYYHIYIDLLKKIKDYLTDGKNIRDISALFESDTLKDDERFGDGKVLNGTGRVIARIFPEAVKHAKYRIETGKDFIVKNKKLAKATKQELFNQSLIGLIESEENLFHLFKLVSRNVKDEEE